MNNESIYTRQTMSRNAKGGGKQKYIVFGIFLFNLE
jgi:hypothetical protein